MRNKIICMLYTFNSEWVKWGTKMLKSRMFFVVILWGFFVQGKEIKMKKITVTSTEFTQGGAIPSKYTCDGQNMNPPLSWEGVPAEAKSLVLICDDPDAPKGTWIHWILVNIPSNVRSLPEDVELAELGSAHELTTSFGKPGYGGPCPPSGKHRYYFKLYALDKDLSLSNQSTLEDLHAAMQGYIVAEGALMGTYSRAQK